MAKNTATVETSVVRTPKPQAPIRRFEAPSELAEKFCVQSHDEYVITGLVKTEDIRELLDVFGLQDRLQLSFPFSHLKRQHGEVWSFRIEPIATHALDGQAVMAHSWVFSLQSPERVTGQQ